MRLLSHVLLATLGGARALTAQSSTPPLSEYMMARDAEVALAKSAAPAGISERASIKVLSATGYQVVHEGDNGFVCLVQRGWSAPTLEGVAFAYMFSANQYLGPGIGAFHPHLMVFAPYHDNAMLGGNAFGGPLPFVSDDAGTPFAVTVIPVDHALAVR